LTLVVCINKLLSQCFYTVFFFFWKFKNRKLLLKTRTKQTLIKLSFFVHNFGYGIRLKQTLSGSMNRITMYARKLAILFNTIPLPTLIDFPVLLTNGFSVKYWRMKFLKLDNFIGFLQEEPTWRMISEDWFAQATMATIIQFTTISAGICMSFKVQF
jgi:hypothetical protein